MWLMGGVEEVFELIWCGVVWRSVAWCGVVWRGVA